MSSKAARRRLEFQKREEKRQAEKARRDAVDRGIKGARDIESLAKAMGVKLK